MFITVSSIISSILKLFSAISIDKVLIAIVFFVPKREQGLLSQKEKKEGIEPCSLISWVFVGNLFSGL